MSKTDAANQSLQAVRDPDREQWSEAMQACRPKERLFIVSLLQGMSGAAAAREAGLGTPESSSQTFARVAHRILTRDRVVVALASEAKKAVRSLAPDAVRAVREIVNDIGHKDRLRAATSVLDRIDPVVSKVEGKIEHVHTLDHEQEALAQLRTLKALGVAQSHLISVFGEFGLERLEKQLAIEDQGKPPIEVEFTEVVPDPDNDILGSA